MECGKSLVTFKGPVQASTMKLREELETVAADGSLLVRIFEELGFEVWFRYEKYREEFALDDVIVALDETPLGVFVELEGGEAGIAAMAEALGRRPEDYVLDSYRGLFVRHCAERGVPVTDMLF
jgi:adenylate cyclase class 2